MKLIVYRASHEPTPEQVKAGNYRKVRRRFAGLDITVENPAGSVRRGVDRNGHAWETRMVYDYGYVRGSLGVDGDQVDVYLGPNEDAPMVYVVHQRKAGDWEKYDEDKCMVGFLTEGDARTAFLQHYDDERFLGPITAMPIDEFRAKVRATKEAPKMIKAILFLKSHVEGHERTLPDGRTVHVKPYETRRVARIKVDPKDARAAGQGDLFLGPAREHKPVPADRAKDPDKFTDDMFGDKHVMPKDEAIKEHERLVDVLNSPARADDKAEAKKQAAELAEIKGEEPFMRLKAALRSGDLAGAMKVLEPLDAKGLNEALIYAGFAVGGSSKKAMLESVQKQLTEAAQKKVDGFGLRKEREKAAEEHHELTPKQYHDRKLKGMSSEYGISEKEVREMYDDDAGRKANEQEWVNHVRAAFKDGKSLSRQTLDKLEEIRPGAVNSFLHDYPDAKVPSGYQTPAGRQKEKEESRKAPLGHSKKFYATVIRNPGPQQKVGWLAGPFDTHEEAKDHVERAKQIAHEVDPRSVFDYFGTTALTHDKHPAGVLNERLGITGKGAPMPKSDPGKDRTDWEDKVYDAVAEALGASRGDAQGVVDARGEALADAWKYRLAPKSAAKMILDAGAAPAAGADDDHPAPIPRRSISGLSEGDRAKWIDLHRQQHELHYYEGGQIREQMERVRSKRNKAETAMREAEAMVASERKAPVQDTVREREFQKHADTTRGEFEKHAGELDRLSRSHESVHRRMEALGKQKDAILPGSGDLRMNLASGVRSTLREELDNQKHHLRAYREHYKAKSGKGKRGSTMAKSLRILSIRLG